MNTGRIAYMDGLRGVAIIIVLLFHVFARWNNFLPYAEVARILPPLNYGFVGVQLFFMLSGYVILMTLEKTASFAEFAWKRWLRLFPAMLIGSLIVYISAQLLPDRPTGSLEPKNLLPGLTFIEPQVWGHLVGFPQKSVEGAFWTLYVEVKFYLVAGLSFYWRGRRFMISLITSVFLVSATVLVASDCLGSLISEAGTLSRLFHYTSFIHFGWFGSGCCFYLHHSSANRKYFYSGCLLAALSCPFTTHFPDPKAWENSIAALAAGFFFVISLYSKHLQYALSARALLFFGSISYPLYLIHENSLVAAIRQLTKTFGDGPLAYFYPIPVIGILCILAFLIASFAEPWFRSLLKMALTKLPLRAKEAVSS